MLKKGGEKRNGLDAKTMTVERGRPRWRFRGFGRLEEVQGGWKKCREAGRDAGRPRAQSLGDKCREVSRSAGLGRPRGRRGHPQA
jgi:hypothetical protein